MVRNIYFPFDADADTLLSMTTEMVAELDIMDHKVIHIAKMIGGERRFRSSDSMPALRTMTPRGAVI